MTYKFDTLWKMDEERAGRFRSRLISGIRSLEYIEECACMRYWCRKCIKWARFHHSQLQNWKFTPSQSPLYYTNINSYSRIGESLTGYTLINAQARRATKVECAGRVDDALTCRERSGSLRWAGRGLGRTKNHRDGVLDYAGRALNLNP